MFAFKQSEKKKTIAKTCEVSGFNSCGAEVVLTVNPLRLNINMHILPTFQRRICLAIKRNFNR